MTTHTRTRTWLVAVVLPFALLAAACGDGAGSDAPDGSGSGTGSGVGTGTGSDVGTGTGSDVGTGTSTGTDGRPEEEHAEGGAVDPVGERRQILTRAPGNDCSATGNQVTPAPAPDLPDEVAALRETLIDAALRCDEQFLRTAIGGSDAFTAGFGGEVDALALWWSLEAAGEQPFLRLAEVLATTPGVVEGGDGPIHVWPRVSTGQPQDTTELAWSEVTWVDDLAAARALGDGYVDWRTGISDDGQWRYFVRGD